MRLMEFTLRSIACCVLLIAQSAIANEYYNEGACVLLKNQLDTYKHAPDHPRYRSTRRDIDKYCSKSNGISSAVPSVTAQVHHSQISVRLQRAMDNPENITVQEYRALSKDEQRQFAQYLIDNMQAQTAARFAQLDAQDEEQQLAATDLAPDADADLADDVETMADDSDHDQADEAELAQVQDNNLVLPEGMTYEQWQADQLAQSEAAYQRELEEEREQRRKQDEADDANSTMAKIWGPRPPSASQPNHATVAMTSADAQPVDGTTPQQEGQQLSADDESVFYAMYQINPDKVPAVIRARLDRKFGNNQPKSFSSTPLAAFIGNVFSGKGRKAAAHDEAEIAAESEAIDAKTKLELSQAADEKVLN